jgi:hypothetical protein
MKTNLYIASLVSKNGTLKTRYLVKTWKNIRIGCNVDFEEATRKEALRLSYEEANRHVSIHNSFCQDSPYRAVIIPVTK